MGLFVEGLSTTVSFWLGRFRPQVAGLNRPLIGSHCPCTSVARLICAFNREDVVAVAHTYLLQENLQIQELIECSRYQENEEEPSAKHVKPIKGAAQP